MTVTGAAIRAALVSVGAVGKQLRSFDELAAGADAALRAAPPGLTPEGAASFLADKAQESAYFRTTTEYGTKLRYDPYRGRGFQMVTWRENYASFGAWCRGRGLVSDANVFVNNPAALSDYRWAWLTGTWYFEANNLWGWANAGDHLRVSQAVNGGRGRAGTSFVPNHWRERNAMFQAFRKLGSTLLPSGHTALPAPGADTGPESIPALEQGAVGPAVHRLATWLNRQYPAYSRIDVDADPARQRYGPQTSAVLKEWQRRSGVRGGDGRNLGPQTRAALWAAGYRPTDAPASVAVAASVPAGPPLQGDEMFVQTPMPPTDDEGNITTPKNTWPTLRVPLGFRPNSGLLKVDHCGRGGWIHLGRWWVRARDWTPNRPLHDPQDHPMGDGGSERFVGFGWETGAPAGADMIELVLSAPDGVHIQWWRTN